MTEKLLLKHDYCICVLLFFIAKTSPAIDETSKFFKFLVRAVVGEQIKIVARSEFIIF